MRLLIVDAFVREGRPLTGNPAAVCLLEDAGWPEDAWMQSIAGEMNLSETAFVLPTGEADRFGLRWFTPAAEVQLCGHATLASAQSLAGEGRIRGRVRFDLKWHGGIVVEATGGGGGWMLGFPAQRCEREDPPAGLLETLGVAAGDAAWIGFGPYDWIVELGHAAAVGAVAPDFAGLARFDCRGVAVCSADGAAGYACRFFAPSHRIAEDPVTGSLQCVLGPHFAAKLGRPDLTVRQLSGRGGELTVEVAGDRVRIGGRAVTVLRGELTEAAVRR